MNRSICFSALLASAGLNTPTLAAAKKTFPCAQFPNTSVTTDSMLKKVQTYFDNPANSYPSLKETKTKKDADKKTATVIAALEKKGPLNPVVELAELSNSNQNYPIYISPLLSTMSMDEIQFVTDNPHILLKPETEAEKKLQHLIEHSVIDPVRDPARYFLTTARLIRSRYELGLKLKSGKDRDLFEEAQTVGFKKVPAGTLAYRFDSRSPDAIKKDKGFSPNPKRLPGTLVDHVYGLGFGNGSFVSFSSKSGNAIFLANPYSKSSTVPESLSQAVGKQYERIMAKGDVLPDPGRVYDSELSTINFEYEAKGDRFVTPPEEMNGNFVEDAENELVTDKMPLKNITRYRAVAYAQNVDSVSIRRYRILGPWVDISTPVEKYAEIFAATQFKKPKANERDKNFYAEAVAP